MQSPNPIDTFLHEADDLLAEIEAAALEMSGQDMEAVNRIFRAFHTIKGSGAMFGFDAVAGFTHHVETLLDEVREQKVAVTEGLSNIILAAVDHIKLLLQAAQGGAAVNQDDQDALLARVAELSSPAGSIPLNELEKGQVGEAGAASWTIRFRPDASLFARGGNPSMLFGELAAMGECEVMGEADLIPPLADMDPESCYLRWTIRLKGEASEAAIRDVFLFVEQGAELEVTADTTRRSEVAAQSAQPATQEMRGPAKPREVASPREAAIRVPAARLDRLVSLVGELVMNQSRLTTAADEFHSAELAAPVEEIERLVSELRDEVLQIRMMPIGSIFGRFRRLVHDLSQQLGKDIELVTEGEETELDKSILDQLAEPLVHLLRNSIDHGIEPADVRVAAGKPAQGTIRLVAAHRGSDVMVSIEDDGKGLDRSAIRAKAVAKGLIAADANLSEKELLNLILLPGFSTAASVTSVSGRGVGMDVVKRQIDALSGTIAITSEPGQGARMSLTLPLTLAIIDGLLVEVGESQYIIPMAVVAENVEITQAERRRNNGRNLVPVRGALVPYIDLRETFGMMGAPPPISKIVLVRYEDQRVGLVVDRVLGTHQTVIQVLGRFFRKIQVVSGSTVMGDGRVALILDIAGVVRQAESQGIEVEAA